MSDQAPSITRSAFRFLGLLLLLTVVWAGFVGPSYDTCVAVVSGQALRSLEAPRMTAGIGVDGAHAVVAHTPEFAAVPDQRLELRTHHNNMPLLVALILATPGLTGRQRLRALALGAGVLSFTHVLHFMLTVQTHYAFFNVGPYHVGELKYVDAGFIKSLESSAQTLKILVGHAQSFFTHVGRRILPILLWMIVCREPLASYARRASARGS